MLKPIKKNPEVIKLPIVIFYSYVDNIGNTGNIFRFPFVLNMMYISKEKMTEIIINKNYLAIVTNGSNKMKIESTKIKCHTLYLDHFRIGSQHPYY